VASTASAEMESSKQREVANPSSVPGLLLTAALKHSKRDALNHKNDGEWVSISAETFVERVRNVALGLADFGIKPGDRIALLSENRPEWSIADLAILSLGAINVPIYTTQAVDQIRYILTDSGARAIFISNRKLYKHAQKALAGLDFLE
jgi:long-chain acyl-CoA synthetase